MIALQARRLRSAEAEGGDYLFRQEADFHFLVVAMWRMRQAGVVARSEPAVRRDLKPALRAFDAALPGLKKMRDIFAHSDVYAVDLPARHDKSVDRRMLQVASWDEETFVWLGQTLSVLAAERAADDLLAVIRRVQRRVALAG